MSTELPTRRVGALVEPCTEKVSGTKRSDFRYVGLEHMESESPFLLGTAPAAASASTNNVFDQDDILFGKLRPYLRKSVRAPFAGYCSTDILVLRANPNVDARFAAKVFQSNVVFDHATATSIGTRMPRTSWSSLSELEVFCPHAIGEQRRIAEILDTLYEAIRTTETLIAKLEQVKKGLLHDLLTRGIDDNGELRDPERHPEQFKDSPLGRIPREWTRSTAGTEFEVQAGFTIGQHRRPTHHPHPYLRVANVHAGRLDLTDVAMLEARPSELSGRTLEINDILVVEGHANPYEIGRAALATEAVRGFTFQNHLFRLRPLRMEPSYAIRSLNGHVARAHWLRVASSSSGLNTINQAKLAAMPVFVPPHEEQLHIAARSDSLDRRLEEEGRQVAKLRLLKAGLMDDLLSGRVRVSVDSQGGSP